MLDDGSVLLLLGGFEDGEVWSNAFRIGYVLIFSIIVNQVGEGNQHRQRGGYIPCRRHDVRIPADCGIDEQDGQHAVEELFQGLRNAAGPHGTQARKISPDNGGYADEENSRCQHPQHIGYRRYVHDIPGNDIRSEVQEQGARQSDGTEYHQ